MFTNLGVSSEIKSSRLNLCLSDPHDRVLKFVVMHVTNDGANFDLIFSGNDVMLVSFAHQEVCNESRVIIDQKR